MRNLEVLKKQGRELLDQRRDEFVRQSLLSDEFLNMIQKNKKPMDLLMSYYQCAIMEIETKFRVLNQEYSLEYDRNPIEGIKTRVKSYESILKKIRKKNIPINLESIEENIRDIAGVRVICSFPEDIYEIAESFLRQDDIILIEKKDYINEPKPSGYRSLHLIVRARFFYRKQRSSSMWRSSFGRSPWTSGQSLEHKLRYKKNIPAEQEKLIQEELYDCSIQSAELDKRMQDIRNMIIKANGDGEE